MHNEPLLHETLPVMEADHLAFPDRFLLWSIRKWVIGHKGVPQALAMLESAFSRTGMPCGAFRLDALMQAVTAGAARRIAVHAPCCSQVSQDEILLLDAIALAQTDTKVDVAFLLQQFLTPAGARIAEQLLRELACALEEAGMRLTLRTRRVPRTGYSVLASVPVGATVH
jgi:hypothetical protein